MIDSDEENLQSLIKNSLSVDTDKINNENELKATNSFVNGNDDNDEEGKRSIKSFLLFDECEKICIKSEEEFLFNLNKITNDSYVKCVSIFGNTGDGKSYCLNQLFFEGKNVFLTSSKQQSCTIGVHCAYDPKTSVVIFDTEGLLSVSTNEDKRTRLLLKILAISDVIIYKTRAERLHNDLFKFLSDASSSYLKYFSNELKLCLQKLNSADISALGPCIVLFHETHHTEPLRDDNIKTVQMQINEMFTNLNLNFDAFRSIDYIGVKVNNNNKKFLPLKDKLTSLINNNSIRSPRKISVIYHLLKSLNDKFNGSITIRNTVSKFPDEYFTCNESCLACGKNCKKTLSHVKEGILHDNSDRCRYDHQFDNKVYICTKCHEEGKEVLIKPKTYSENENVLSGFFKYAISGYVLECPSHGVIYRSREYWYGNEEPEKIVRTEIKHVWKDQKFEFMGTSLNTGRKVIDAITFLGDTINEPKDIAYQWIADKVAPSYWIPNVDIVNCHACKIKLEKNVDKHHCRCCGKGFCDSCSSKRKIIEWWSKNEKVRVCNDCYNKKDTKEPALDTTSRKVSEALKDTLGYIGGVTIKYPLNMLKESTRPLYWQPDEECLKCHICAKEFNKSLNLHHCRSCGKGVCSKCSPFYRPVTSRGWDSPVRVCSNCKDDDSYSNSLSNNDCN